LQAGYSRSRSCAVTDGLENARRAALRLQQSWECKQGSLQGRSGSSRYASTNCDVAPLGPGTVSAADFRATGGTQRFQSGRPKRRNGDVQ